MAGVELTGVRKIYPNGAEAVRGVDMKIEHGEFIVFVGPSGCGKSTLLRMIAGLESITSGDIKIDDRVRIVYVAIRVSACHPDLMPGMQPLDFMRTRCAMQTIKMIIGDERAPWEDPRTAQALLKPLGSLRRIVLGLLERDPNARMTMEQAQSAIKRLLLNSTMTVGSSDFEVQSVSSSSQQPYTQNTEPENRLESVHE